MDQHSIILRVAKPTLDGGLAFARYLDEAAECFFRFMLGRHADRTRWDRAADADHFTQ